MLKAISQLTLNNISIVYRDVIHLIKGSKVVALDLSHINEIDSSGIALLCELKQVAKTYGSTLNLQNPSSAVLRLCKLYKITLL